MTNDNSERPHIFFFYLGAFFVLFTIGFLLYNLPALIVDIGDLIAQYILYAFVVFVIYGIFKLFTSNSK